ncbi:MAG: hypothetical protein JW702_03145 [Clostridiales bacterium]|nr:hypothetical protein [Clostridiales bacterium]
MLLNICIYFGFIIVFIKFLLINESRKMALELKKIEYLNNSYHFGKAKLDMGNLPDPIKRYLVYSGALDREWIKKVTVYEEGHSKKYFKYQWIKFLTVKNMYLNTITFIGESTYKVMPLIQMKVDNKFKNSNGERRLLIFSAIALDQSSRKFEISQSLLVKYFSEMVYAPTAFISDNIEWHSLGKNLVKGILNLKGFKVEAEISINDEGQITNFIAQRYLEEHGKYKLEIWSAEFKNYRNEGGVMIPSERIERWHFDEEIYINHKSKLKGIRFN